MSINIENFLIPNSHERKQNLDIVPEFKYSNKYHQDFKTEEYIINIQMDSMNFSMKPEEPEINTSINIENPIYKNVFEPYRIKSVIGIKTTTKAERLKYLLEANYNVFKLDADNVMIDLLTDSGTGSLSSEQMGGLMKGDESYAGSSSWKKFEKIVKHITGMHYIFPTHQGRAAERILFTVGIKKGDIIPNNSHFDTTRANIEDKEAIALDFLIPEGKKPSLFHPFKGNMDTGELKKFLTTNFQKVPMVYMTITNNTAGGQPVSMENLKEVRKICDEFKLPLFLDSCRYAENAWFIKNREPGYENKTIKEIVQEMFDLADGTHMSTKKDGLSNTGGFLGFKMNMSELAFKCQNNLILTEGYLTYGGLTGYDMEIITIGLEEGLNEKYLTHRIGQVHYLGKQLRRAGIPIIWPIGGHAVYIDAKALLPHIPPLEYPAWAFTTALYIEGGIRSVEIGSVMFGRQPDGTEKESCMELVRLAIPRRTYTKSHMDYIVEVIVKTIEQKYKIFGLKIINEPPALRHFLADFIPIHNPLPHDICTIGKDQRRLSYELAVSTEMNLRR